MQATLPDADELARSPLDDLPGFPSPALRAWRICTEPDLQDAILAGFQGRTTNAQSELLSAWVWARVMDYRWKQITDLLDAYRESLVEDVDDHAA